MLSNKSKREKRSKSEKQSSDLKLGTGIIDQKVLNLIDFGNLMSWFELASFERLQRNTSRATETLQKRLAGLPATGDDASDDERRSARDTASAITTLIMRAEAARNAAFGAVMERANERFPPTADHPFYVRIDGQPSLSYLTGMLLVPSIRQVRKALWCLAIAAKQARTTVELPVALPTRRTRFNIRPDGKVEVQQDRVTALNDVIVAAINGISDVRRLRICNLRQRRKGNHTCGRIFWADRRDKFQCCDEHRDLARKHEKRPGYEERRRRKNRPGAPYTDPEISELSKAIRNIETETEKFTLER